MTLGRMRALVALSLSLWLAACATVRTATPTQEQARAELIDADRAFSRVAQEKGLAWAFADAMDPVDGKLFRPGRIVRGRAEIEAAPFPKEGNLAWEPTGVEASASGDLGVTWGRWVFQSPDGVPRGTGAYITVWRRDGEGRWRGLLDIGNDDPREPPKP